METTAAFNRAVSGRPVSIPGFPVMLGAWDMEDILLTGAVHTVYGMTQAIWIITGRHWFLTVVTSIMSQAIMTCIAPGIGTLTTTDSDLNEIVRRQSRAQSAG
jgi:hypothetical protein